jgi:hypothetical protein
MHEPSHHLRMAQPVSQCCPGVRLATTLMGTSTPSRPTTCPQLRVARSVDFTGNLPKIRAILP